MPRHGGSFFEAIADLSGSQDQLSRLLDEAPFGVYADHPTSGCIYANDALLRQFGVTWSDFEGFGWARFVFEEDAARLRDRIAEYERDLEPIHVSYRVRDPENSTRWIHARVEPIVRDGRHVGSIGITQEVTDERMFQERMARTQKLEAIGRLAARLAHDFNNLLTPMLFSVDMLDDSPTREAVGEATGMIRMAIERARQLTQQLLSLSRHKVGVTSSCRFDQELEQLAPLLRRTIGEGIELVLDLQTGDASVPLQSNQLGQIVLNLVTNAADAMSGYGRIDVRSTRTDERVHLEVEDRGVGMDAQVLANAIEPFFTTKEVGRGTGLGLATVHDLVTLVGGELAFRTATGKGTTVHIDLPVVEMIEVDAGTPAEAFSGSGDGLEVLLVEDMDALRQSLAYALALQGFKVTGARSMAQARERLAGDYAPDVLITDVMLPDGSSPDLVDELRRQRPDLPVLFMSGYVGESQVVTEAHRHLARFLQKPFGPADLLRELGRLLAEREDCRK